MRYPVRNLGASLWQQLQPYGGWGNAPSSPPPPPPETVKEFRPISTADYVRFCNIVRAWDASPRMSQGRQDAMDAWNALIHEIPMGDQHRQAITEYVQARCPSPDFYQNIVNPVVVSTPPYRSPGMPVATGEPGFVHPDMPTPGSYIPARGMTPSIAPMPMRTFVQPSAPAPVMTPGGTQSSFLPHAPEQCPPGQFWDGRQCRGSVGAIPTLPGGFGPSGGIPFVMRGIRIANLT